MPVKKIIPAFFILCLLAPSWQAFSGEKKSTYVPADNIKVPNLGSEWNVKLGDDKTRVEYIHRPLSGAQEGAEIKSSIKLIREPLDVQAQKNPGVWQGEVRRDLKKEFGKVETGKKKDSPVYEATYSTTEDLIPVSGSRFYFTYDHWLYEWRCDMESDSERDPKQWCYDKFQAIQWPDKVPVKTSNRLPDFENAIKSFPLDNTQLGKIGQRIVSNFQEGAVTLEKLYRYGYFLVFKSLFFPPADDESRIVFLDNLDRLADTVETLSPSPVFPSWLRAQRDYLGGDLAYPDVEKLVHLDKRPPYWLLSLWVAPSNLDTAVYLARRQRGHSPLYSYVLGKTLLSAGSAHQAIPFLKSAARQKNILAMNTLAQSYLNTGQTDKAIKAAKSAVKSDSDDIDSWLLLAQALSGKDSEANTVRRIYDHLAAKPDVSKGDRVKIALQEAKNSENPSDSLVHYQEVLALDPANLESLYAAGRIYLLEKNDRAKGVDLFQRYLDVAPRKDERVEDLVRMVRDLKVEIHGSVWNPETGYQDPQSDSKQLETAPWPNDEAQWPAGVEQP